MESSVSLGIGFGLGAAVFQSLSYLCIRLFNKRHNDNIITLLVLSHILMGLVSIPLALFLWADVMPGIRVYLWGLLGTAGFYLLGLLACVCYCLSDLCIKIIVGHFAFLGILRGAVMATALSYILCGVVGVAAVVLFLK